MRGRRSFRVTAAHGVRRRVRRLAVWGARDSATWLALSAVIAALVVLRVLEPSYSPVSALLGPLIAGGLLLSTRWLRLLIVLVIAGLVVEATAARFGTAQVPSLLIVLLGAVVGYAFSLRRSRLGLTSARSDAMLVELRDRLRAHGEVPALPTGWHVEVVLRSAGGSAFAGDFFVTSLDADSAPLLELVLVDVSGSGVASGTRALQLSGAMGGLLGSVAPARFLGVANRYLIQHPWPEGFATAVHVAIELGSGDFDVFSAGHPPAVHYDAGSGRWQLSAASGPLLGVFDDVTHDGSPGTLRPGDAVMMYTDGLVESPGRDIEVGIDRLLGAAERIVHENGLAGTAERLVDEVPMNAGDDRGLVLCWRDPA